MKKSILIITIICVLFSSVIFAADKVVPNTAGNVTTEVMSEAFKALDNKKAMSSTVQVGDKTIITFFEVKSFFLNGTFGTPVKGSGVVGKIDLTPYAVMIVSPDDVKMIPVMKEKPIFTQIVNALPTLLETVMKYFMVDSKSVTVVEEPVDTEVVGKSDELIEEKVEAPVEEISTENPADELAQRLMKASKKEELTEISKKAESLLQSNPDDSMLNAVAGYSLMRSIDDKTPPLQQMSIGMKASNLLDKAVKLDPENPLANLGVAWMNLYNPMGSVDKSVKSFEKVLEIQPENSEAMIGLIQAYQKVGKNEEAKNIAKKGMELYPDEEYFKSILK